MPDPSSTTQSIPRDRVPVVEKAAYAMGGITDLYGHYLYATMAMPVYNIYCGLSPTAVGNAMMITRLFDGFLDPLFGWISDNTRSRLGRRRPYILAGAILAGLALPFLFAASPSWSPDQIFWFMIVSLLLYTPLISCFNMPYQSLGAELSPDYNERTSVMSWRAFVQKAAGIGMNYGLVIATSSYFLVQETGKIDVLKGARYACTIAGAIMILGGVSNFIFVRERFYEAAKRQERISFVQALRGILANKPYLSILATALFFAIPAGLVYQIGLYTTIYHVCGGKMDVAANLNAVGGVAYGILGFVGVPLASWISSRWGKTNAMKILFISGILSYVVTWWLFTPEYRWLSIVCVGFQGLTATGVWVILPSMCIDTVDYDELRTHSRREGVYVSYFSWMIKLGLSLSTGMSGWILDWIGFDATRSGGEQSLDTILQLRFSFAFIPSFALFLGLIFIWFYPLSRSRMCEIRESLEMRRGSI